jgi:two-component system sensor histidine kinase KdpD
MVQVLVNLLDNALKYSPPGSPLDIVARRADGSAEGQTEGWVEVAVADRGLGIPPEDLTRIFDKFYRVQRSGARSGPNGTGLGLSICQGIVEAHGGRIWAENRPGGRSSLWRCR